MVIKCIDRNINDKIKVGVRCHDCGEILDYERFIYELNFRSNKKQIVLCERCAVQLRNELNKTIGPEDSDIVKIIQKEYIKSEL